MAKNVAVKNGRIYKLGKKKIGARLLKKIKKLVRYNAIKGRILESRYDMVLGTINVEFTSYCNLRCRMCPNSIDTDTRGRGFMDIGLFKERIVDYIVNNPKYHFDLINLWQGGEILLYPKFEDILSIVGKARDKYKRFPQVNLLTNAMLLDKKNSKIILDSGAVDEIYFSVDCGNKKSFEDTRCGARWETVLENVNNFINLNNDRGDKITTGIFSIIALEKYDEFAPEFLELVKRIDYFHPRPAHNYDGNYSLNLGENKAADLEPKKGLCGRVTNTVAVLWNGKVVPCCLDLTGRGVIGDLNKQALFDIFNSAARKRYIGLMRQGNRSQIELCKNCSM